MTYARDWLMRGGTLVAEMRAIFARLRASWTGAETLSVWDRFTRPRLNNARNLGDLPLAVISVTEQPLAGQTLTALQNELPRLSRNSVHHLVSGATHEDLVSHREYADSIASSIREVARAATSGAPLADLKHAPREQAV